MPGVAEAGVGAIISNLSGWAFVGMMVFFLLTGRFLATRREVEDAQKTAETFKAAWEKSQESNEKLSLSVEELLENSRATRRVLETIYDRSQAQVRQLESEGPS